MMKHLPITYRHRRALPVVLASLLLVAACTDTRPADPRQAFPIAVTSENASLSVEVTEKGLPASYDDGMMVQRFIRDYMNRGRSKLTINVGAGEQIAAEQMRSYVAGLGVPKTNIATRFGNTGQNLTVLGFVGYKAHVPECGDWSRGENFLYSNARSPNFGCSVRRNIGLMVTDPGDLIRSKPSGNPMAEPGINAINTSLKPAAASPDLTSSTTGAADAATSSTAK